MVHPMDQNKRSFLPLLRKGIDFALSAESAPANFGFLSAALLPFVSRSSKADAKQT
jgi:hypothetical protein